MYFYLKHKQLKSWWRLLVANRNNSTNCTKNLKIIGMLNRILVVEWFMKHICILMWSKLISSKIWKKKVHLIKMLSKKIFCPNCSKNDSRWKIRSTNIIWEFWPWSTEKDRPICMITSDPEIKRQRRLS